MTRSLQIAVLAALSVLILSPAPATSAPKRFPCENAQDCPAGDICVTRRAYKVGFCASPRQGLGPCKSAKDCGKGGICQSSGNGPGTCVFPRFAGPCEDARDCPKGDICNKKKPGDKTGVCVAPKKSSRPS